MKEDLKKWFPVLEAFRKELEGKGRVALEIDAHGHSSVKISKSWRFEGNEFSLSHQIRYPMIEIQGVEVVVETGMTKLNHLVADRMRRQAQELEGQ